MEPLPMMVEDIESVPEPIRPFYVRAGDSGPFRMNVENPELETQRRKVDEFRTNNTTYKKERDEALEGLKAFRELGLSAAEIRTALDEKGNLEIALSEAGGGKPEEVEKKVAAKVDERLALSKRTHESELKAAAEKYRGIVHRTAVDNAIKEALTGPYTPADGAMEDILNRARAIWSVDPETDKIVARRPNGDLAYGVDAKTPMTPQEYIEELAKGEGRHLFVRPTGGGARGSSPGSQTAGGVRWITQEEWETGKTELREAHRRGEVKIIGWDPPALSAGSDLRL